MLRCKCLNDSSYNTPMYPDKTFVGFVFVTHWIKQKCVMETTMSPLCFNLTIMCGKFQFKAHQLGPVMSQMCNTFSYAQKQAC